jgi:glycosyltransferase involved in cell wall biosynthesis
MGEGAIGVFYLGAFAKDLPRTIAKGLPRTIAPVSRSQIRDETVLVSVIIPTFDRRPILAKCLAALEAQTVSESGVADYEVIVVDDGSTDDTIAYLETNRERYPHVRCFSQSHRGPAAARNLGLEKATGETIVFIDSDLVVTEHFLQAHLDTLHAASVRSGSDRLFTYGRVINTNNFENPTAEPYKVTDFSAAYFATGNVAIARKWLDAVGGFDPRFQQYGWEDLELGVRLKKQLGLKLVKCPQAVGYHWHPPFCLDDLPRAIDREIERGRMGVLFYQKHPTWDVKMMIQMTWLHRVLWGVLSLGGRLNERSMAGLLQWAIDRGHAQIALELSRIFLNWYNVRAVYAAYNATFARQRATNKRK